MRHCHCTITSRQVHDQALDRLQAALRLRDHGPKCSATVVLNILFWAAARVTSLAAACAALVAAPCDQAVRNALLATLPAFAQRQCRLNRALAGGLPKMLRGHRHYVAIDLTLLPYYGQPLGHRLRPLSRLPLHRGALRAVHHADPWDQVVGDLLRQVRQTGLKVRCLLLDRGFYRVSVIRYLQAARCPFVMPVIRRGRKPSHPQGASGTWAFTTCKRSAWARHTLQDNQQKRQATVTIAVCRHRLPQRTRSGRRLRGRRCRIWLYALWGLKASSVAWVRELYRRRFGIESSYRQLNQARIRTSSRSPLLRLLFVGLALVLRNVWVWLHGEVLAKKRRGKRRLDLDQLPLRALMHWLQEVVEAIFGVKESAPSERPWVA